MDISKQHCKQEIVVFEFEKRRNWIHKTIYQLFLQRNRKPFLSFYRVFYKHI